MEGNKLLYYGIVKDVNDPKHLGRLRIEPKTEVIKYVYPNDFVFGVDEWTNKDPLVFLPLLPNYLWQIPRVGEFVTIIYANKEERYDANKFYIQGPISRPWNNNYEDYSNSQSVLASGENLKQSESIVDPQSGKVRVTLEGVYPKPGDNAFMGRGSSDIVLTQNDAESSSSVLVRSGKYLKSGNENIPVVKNDNRGFLQLSSYELENVDAGTDSVTRETFEDIATSMYVEWSVDNLSTLSLDYDGTIKLYKLPKNNSNTKVSNINAASDVLSGLTIEPLYTLTFTGKSLEESSTIINNFIRGVNESKIQIDGYINYPAADGLKIENQFPFFYGPNIETYDYSLGNISNALVSIFAKNKVNRLLSKVTLSEGYKEKGSGLVWSHTPPKLGILKNQVTEEVNKRDYLVSPITYSVMGSDKIYLLSHRSTDKFLVDLKDTLYGIPQSKLAVDIYDRTNSMVRGEELLSLLQLIVQFLSSHVHAFPGLSPVPVGNDGTQLADILAKLAAADNVILNQNIRIN
jgi:hypothetical protein